MSTMEEDFRKMNSDGYEEEYKKCFYHNPNISSVASEYEMPREPKFYSDNSKLPNIPIYNIKELKSNGDRICNTCNKEDVCMYKAELAQAAKEITQISERKNVFIDTDIRCKKWSEKISNYR